MVETFMLGFTAIGLSVLVVFGFFLWATVGYAFLNEVFHVKAPNLVTWKEAVVYTATGMGLTIIVGTIIYAIGLAVKLVIGG